MSAQSDLLRIVAALQDAFNRHAVDEIMAMFADGAVLELKGLARLVGKEEIRPIFEYDVGVNGSIQFLNCTAADDTVNCQFVEANDRLRAAGLDNLLYPSCVLSFENDLIRSWWAVPDQVPSQTFDQFWGPVRAWIAKNYPNDYQRMYTPEGRFIRSRDNGERVVQLARQYRSMVTP